jgi:translation initiation factor 2B subunit (eIF-2B alpha/beta/delta family)
MAFNLSEESDFIQACSRGDEEKAKELLVGSPDLIEKTASNGSTPLIFAACAESVEVVEFLLKNKADINALSPKGVTALWFATRDQRWSVVEKLLEAGAGNLDATPVEGGFRGTTALWWAAFYNQWPLVKKLITLGANVNIGPISQIPGGKEETLIAKVKKTLVEERAALAAQKAREETRHRHPQAAVEAQTSATRAPDVNAFLIKMNEQAEHITKVIHEFKSLAKAKQILQKAIRDDVSANIQLLRKPLSGRQNKSRKLLLEKNIKYLTELQTYLSTISEWGNRVEQPIETLLDLMKVLKGEASPFEILNLKYSLERSDIAFSLSQFVSLCNRLQDPPSIYPPSLNCGEFVTLCQRFKTKFTSDQAFVVQEILESLGKSTADTDQNLMTLKDKLNELRALSERARKFKEEDCTKFTALEKEDGTISLEAVRGVVDLADKGMEVLSAQEVGEKKEREEKETARKNAREERASWLRAQCLSLKIEPPIKKASTPKVSALSAVEKTLSLPEPEPTLQKIAVNQRRDVAVAKPPSSEERKHHKDLEAERAAVSSLSRHEKQLQRQDYQKLRKAEEDSRHRTNEIELLNSRRAFDEAQTLEGREPERSLNVPIANADKKATLELSTLLKTELTRLQAVRQTLPTTTPWRLSHCQALLGSFARFNEALPKENLNTALKKFLAEKEAALAAQKAREETRLLRRQAAVDAQTTTPQGPDVNAFPIKVNEQEGRLIKASHDLTSLANDKKVLQKTIRDNIRANIEVLRRPLSGRQNRSRRTLLEKNIKYLTELQTYLSSISECGNRVEQPIETLLDLMKVLKGESSPFEILNLKYSLGRSDIAFSLSQFVSLCNRLQNPPSIYPPSLNSGEFITLCQRFKTKFTSDQASVIQEILEDVGKSTVDIDQNLVTLKDKLNELRALSERARKCKEEDCTKFTVLEKEDGTISLEAVREVVDLADKGMEVLSAQEVEERKAREEKETARKNAGEERASWLRTYCLLLKIEPPVKKAPTPKVSALAAVEKTLFLPETGPTLPKTTVNQRRDVAAVKSPSSEERKHRKDLETEGTAASLLSRHEKQLQRQQAYQTLRKAEEESWYRTNEIALQDSQRAFYEARALKGLGSERPLNAPIADTEKKATLELSTLLKAELTRLQAVRQALPTVTPWSLSHRQALLGSFACLNEALSKEGLNTVSTVAKRLRNALFKCSYELTEARFPSTALLTMVEKWIGVLQSEDARGIITEEALLMKLDSSHLNELFNLGKSLDVAAGKNHWVEVNARINVPVSVEVVKRCSEALKTFGTEESIIMAESAEDFTWACLSSHLVGLYEAGQAGNKDAMKAFRQFKELKNFLPEIRDRGAIARHSSLDTSLVLSLLSLGTEGLEVCPPLVFSLPARVEVISSAASMPIAAAGRTNGLLNKDLFNI